MKELQDLKSQAITHVEIRQSLDNIVQALEERLEAMNTIHETLKAENEGLKEYNKVFQKAL